jgi:hypothetical protein
MDRTHNVRGSGIKGSRRGGEQKPRRVVVCQKIEQMTQKLYQYVPDYINEFNEPEWCRSGTISEVAYLHLGLFFT